MQPTKLLTLWASIFTYKFSILIFIHSLKELGENLIIDQSISFSFDYELILYCLEKLILVNIWTWRVNMDEGVSFYISGGVIGFNCQLSWYSQWITIFPSILLHSMPCFAQNNSEGLKNVVRLVLMQLYHLSWRWEGKNSCPHVVFYLFHPWGSIHHIRNMKDSTGPS